MGIPSGNMPALSNCTTNPLVGGTSFGTPNIEVSNDNDTSSDGLKSLSCSESFSDRIVTGDLDIDIWIWIIEYFAKFKKELWTLHDVFQMAPTLPHYLGDYANEMVAFRCLAYLFDASSRQDNNVASGAGSKVEFDLSESCEHVLQCILDEIPLSKLKPGAPELLKWNLLPFIKNKRLRLPKCTFELMREASCKNSGVCPNYGEETTGTDSNKINQVAVSGENIDERMNEEGNLFDQGPENGDGELGDKNETSFGKTDLCDVVIPDTFEENEDGNKDTSIVNDIFCAKAKEPNLDPADATMSRFTKKKKKKITDEILSVKLTLPNRIDNVDECSTTKENECFDHGNNQEGRKGVRRSTAHDQGEFVVSEELHGMCEADTGNGQTESSHDVNILPLEVETGITFSTDFGKLLREYPSHEECEDQEKGEDQTQKNGVYNALATNIIQYENVDGRSSSPSPRRYTCKQCNKGGKLLFCSNEGCPTTIHEKCLNCLPAYDDDGNFYCPLCAYTLHSSEFLKSKAQVGEAKKKLVSFLHLVNSRHKRKGISGNQVPSSQH